MSCPSFARVGELNLRLHGNDKLNPHALPLGGGSLRFDFDHTPYPALAELGRGTHFAAGFSLGHPAHKAAKVA